MVLEFGSDLAPKPSWTLNPAGDSKRHLTWPECVGGTVWLEALRLWGGGHKPMPRETHRRSSTTIDNFVVLMPPAGYGKHVLRLRACVAILTLSKWQMPQEMHQNTSGMSAVQGEGSPRALVDFSLL